MYSLFDAAPALNVEPGERRRLRAPAFEAECLFDILGKVSAHDEASLAIVAAISDATN